MKSISIEAVLPVKSIRSERKFRDLGWKAYPKHQVRGSPQRCRWRQQRCRLQQSSLHEMKMIGPEAQIGPETYKITCMHGKITLRIRYLFRDLPSFNVLYLSADHILYFPLLQMQISGNFMRNGTRMRPEIDNGYGKSRS